MAKHRDRIPDDIKELIALCRAGKLFAVQDWIACGNRTELPVGNFATSPLRASVETGFHSIVEVLLRAGVEQTEKNHCLSKALDQRRLDIIELLVEYGAEIGAICIEEVMWTRNPSIINWFVEHDVDLESDFPIARAFRSRNRQFLGIYMGLRERIPTARRQANMALRIHCKEGNLKWVSLLLWAGADPRAEVPDLDAPDDEELIGSALVEAVRRGHIEIVRKIGLDPQRDDVSALLGECWLFPRHELVHQLLQLGANPNLPREQGTPMEALIQAFQWSHDGLFSGENSDGIVRCIELAASAGGRWQPSDKNSMSSLRRALAKAVPYRVVAQLLRIVESGAIATPVLTELLNTPRMKELLHSGAPGSVSLRQLVGFDVVKTRKRRISRISREERSSRDVGSATLC